MAGPIVFSTVDPGATRIEPAAVVTGAATPAAGPVSSGSHLDCALRRALSVALRAEHTMDRMAAVSAHYSLLSASAEFRSTAMRAFRQDVKDPVKDQGEAGRKP